MTELTVHLSDQAAQQAVFLAAMQGRKVEDYVAGLIEQELAAAPTDQDLVVESLSDDDVLQLADLQLPADAAQRLSELLEMNGEGALATDQQQQLDKLMQLHDEGMVKKAMGMAEAVRRKLREPLSP
jgi:hypothetical protein